MMDGYRRVASLRGLSNRVHVGTPCITCTAVLRKD